MPTFRKNQGGLRPALSKNEPNYGSGRNGIKLASELLLDQLLTQFVPGFDHQGEAVKDC